MRAKTLDTTQLQRDCLLKPHGRSEENSPELGEGRLRAARGGSRGAAGRQRCGLHRGQAPGTDGEGDGAGAEHKAGGVADGGGAALRVAGWRQVANADLRRRIK